MNKLERKQLEIKKQQTKLRTNNLWVGMVTQEEYNSRNKHRDDHNKHNDSLSYRMKLIQRDNLKLEREWE